MVPLYKFSLILIFGFSLLVFILLFFVSAPYGKFQRKGWGPAIKSKWAWMIMEAPSPVLMVLLFMVSDNKHLPYILFILFWLAHYLHRTFIYPFTQSGREKQYPIIIVIMALVFNCLNGFINGYGIFHLMTYKAGWLLSWQFITGIILFISGFVINKISDDKFRLLRKENPGEYVIPQGWLFRYISNPHYFGEIIEWGGWAVMTWSLPGLAFFVFTFANLFPRAVSSHRWYKENFKDYPAKRKAIIPFII
jgi:protein-S-isoprenylcysteine O-methyltransferase Ste14